MDDPIFDYKWVEILDYEQQCSIYVNVTTAETCDSPPVGDKVLTLNQGYWLEILCNRTGRLYYYNSLSNETTWEKPGNGLIVPLARVQLIHQQQQQLQQASQRPPGFQSVPLMGSRAASTSSTTNRTNRPLPSLNASSADSPATSSPHNASPRLSAHKEHNGSKKKKRNDPLGTDKPLHSNSFSNSANQNAPLPRPYPNNPLSTAACFNIPPQNNNVHHIDEAFLLSSDKRNSSSDFCPSQSGDSNSSSRQEYHSNPSRGDKKMTSTSVASSIPCPLPTTVFDLVPPLISLNLTSASSTSNVSVPPHSYANIDIIQRQQQQQQQQLQSGNLTTKSGSSTVCSTSQMYSTGASVDSGLPAENPNCWDSLEKLPAVRKSHSKGSSNSPVPTSSSISTTSNSESHISSNPSVCSPLYVNATNLSTDTPSSQTAQHSNDVATASGISGSGLPSSLNSANAGSTVTPNAKHRNFPRTNPIHRRAFNSDRSPLVPPDGEDYRGETGSTDLNSRNGSIHSDRLSQGCESGLTAGTSMMPQSIPYHPTGDMSMSLGGTLASTGSGTGSGSGSGSAPGSGSALFSSGSGKSGMGGMPYHYDLGANTAEGSRPISLYMAEHRQPPPHGSMMIHPQQHIMMAPLISPGGPAFSYFSQQPPPATVGVPYFSTAGNWSANTLSHPYPAVTAPFTMGPSPVIGMTYPPYPAMMMGAPGAGTMLTAVPSFGPYSISGLPIRPGWDPSLFRKGTDIGKLLTWQKDSIHKPLLDNTEKVLKKDALNLFKLIQMYMGDRKSKYPPGELLQIVVQRGKSIPTLRDEIFMQLCKQTTSNSDEMSTVRGWEMICACVQFFPPSEYFCPYLVGYIERHLRAARGVGINGGEECPTSAAVLKLARVAINRLQRGLLYETMSGWLRQTPITLAEVQTAVNSIHNPRMFGSSLDEVMAMQAERFPERQLPWILTTLVAEIFLQNGHRTEGIFRVPANQQSVTELRERCERWNSQLPCPEPHTPATLLKLWLQELAEPLIPASVTPYVLQLAMCSLNARRQSTHASLGSGGNCEGVNASGGPGGAYLHPSSLLDEWDDNVVDQALILVQVNPDVESGSSSANNASGSLIPYINRLCLAYLVWFVQILTQEENQEANRMNSYALSMLLAPNLFPPVPSQAIVLQAYELQTEFFQLLVENWDVTDIAPILA